jgi:type II pantothenate kinase
MNESVFPLLADPDQYVACKWDLTGEDAKRAYWLGLFRTHFPTLIARAVHQEPVAAQADATRRGEQATGAFFAHLDDCEREPRRFARLDILMICEERERVLRRCGFDDPYRAAKQFENDAALKLLPQVIQGIDALGRDPAMQIDRVMRGVFAGNIFDLGATVTNDLFRPGGPGLDFRQVLAKLKPRPWLIDDLDAWRTRLLTGQPHRAAVLFVDNAGPDVVLGMIPLARFLLQRGTKVILTANTTPSLNDVTLDELNALLDRAAALDSVLGQTRDNGRLSTVASGNGAPLIDLKRVSAQLVKAVRDAQVDLVVLEGMGRAVETNLDAKFSVEALKLAMVKDQGVADALGGSVYDLVLRYEQKPQ